MKLTKNQSKVLVVLFFSLLFLIYLFLMQVGKIPNVYDAYEVAVIENNSQFFFLPLSFLVGRAVWSLIENTLIFKGIAFVFFIGTILVILRLYDAFDVKFRWLPLQFIMFPFWMHFCFVFTRDIIFFFTATAFFALMILGHYNKIQKNKLYYFLLVGLLALSVINKVGSMALIVFVLFYFFYGFAKKHINIKKVSAFYLSFIPFEVGWYLKHLLQPFNFFNWLPLNLIALFAFILNPVYFLFSLLIIELRKHKLFLLFFVWVVFSNVFLFNLGVFGDVTGDYGNFYRYAFYLTPIVVFLNGMALDKAFKQHFELALLALVFIAVFLAINAVDFVGHFVEIPFVDVVSHT